MFIEFRRYILKKDIQSGWGASRRYSTICFRPVFTYPD